MKKVIVFKVENVLVKDFNRDESFRRAMAIEVNKLKRSKGVDMVGKELQRIEKEKMEWVDRREREFYKKEFEKSKFKNGCGEIMKVLEVMKERVGVEIVFVSKYRKGKVESVLWSNGLRDMEVESCNGDWVNMVIEKRGYGKEDIVMFSNDNNDIERGEEWGIKVEKLNVEKEGINGFMGKIGLRKNA